MLSDSVQVEYHHGGEDGQDALAELYTIFVKENGPLLGVFYQVRRKMNYVFGVKRLPNRLY